MRVPRSSSRKPNPIDIHVGNRIQLRRILLGLSQQQLAELLGLTFQQVQKYERGTNRTSASRLWDIASALKCSVLFFFQEMDQWTATPGLRSWDGEDNDAVIKTHDQINHHETLDLIRAYHSIDDANVRRRIYQLTKSFVLAKETAVDSQDKEVEIIQTMKVI